jgi:hypothetical protein
MRRHVSGWQAAQLILFWIPYPVIHGFADMEPSEHGPVIEVYGTD